MQMISARFFSGLWSFRTISKQWTHFEVIEIVRSSTAIFDVFDRFLNILYYTCTWFFGSVWKFSVTNKTSYCGNLHIHYEQNDCYVCKTFMFFIIIQYLIGCAVSLLQMGSFPFLLSLVCGLLGFLDSWIRDL